MARGKIIKIRNQNFTDNSLNFILVKNGELYGGFISISQIKKNKKILICFLKDVSNFIKKTC